MKSRRSMLAVWLVAGLVASCGGGRPTMSEWRPLWDDVVAQIPAESEVALGPNTDLCSAVLVELRRSSPDLDPTPDPALDGPVHAWLRLAEEVFFECPPETRELSGFDEAYAELDKIAMEVAAVLSS